jgi:hypothetical protein
VFDKALEKQIEDKLLARSTYTVWVVSKIAYTGQHVAIVSVTVPERDSRVLATT